MIKAKLKFADKQLSIDALNEVIEAINYLQDILSILAMTGTNNSKELSVSENSNLQEIIEEFNKTENL